MTMNEQERPIIDPQRPPYSDLPSLQHIIMPHKKHGYVYQAVLALLTALSGGVLLCIILLLLGVPQLPMLLASEALLVALFSVVFWWPPRHLLHAIIEKVRGWA